jgi:hypothetical protein
LFTSGNRRFTLSERVKTPLLLVNNPGNSDVAPIEQSLAKNTAKTSSRQLEKGAS